MWKSAAVAASLLVFPTVSVADCFSVGVDEDGSLGFTDRVIEEIFERSGLCFTILYMPRQRLERDLLNGALDFNAPRDRSFSETHRELLLVETPLTEAEAVFIQRRETARPISDFKDIASLQAGVALGARWAETALTEAGGAFRTFARLNQMLKVLILGRIDGVLTDKVSLSVWTYGNLLQLDDFDVTRGLAPLSAHIVARTGLEGEVARLDETVREMRASGEIQSMIDAWVKTNIQPQMRYTISGSDDWLPYAPTAGEGGGQKLFTEMVALVLREAGFVAHRVDLDAAAEEQALRRGLIDVELASPDWFGGAYPAPFVSSAPLFSLRDVIIGRNDERQAQGPDDLDGQRVATIAGYVYAGEDRWRRVDFDTENALIAAVRDGATDYGIVAEAGFMRWAESGGEGAVIHSIHSENAITFRLNARLSPFIENLNAAIIRLRAEDAFAAMTARNR